MIHFRNVHKAFGERRILKGIDLDIEAGKTTTILGVSGGGKSTIIKHIVGLLQADSGQIIVDGHDISHGGNEALMNVRRVTGFLFQSGALFDSMNVRDNVIFPLAEHTTMTLKEMHYEAERSLSMVGLDPKEVLSLMPHELSGGMRKRVGLARTLVSKPKIILYDEPTSGLDPISSDHITQMIKNLQAQLRVTSILISHDMKEAFKSSDKMAMLWDGKIIEYGDVRHFQETQNPYVQQFVEGTSEGPIQFVD
ncbi:MAG: ABC transporter [Sulfurovum sp. PC08-66]|nr:MAG: ABC transporter [Sulfurovum sp. PC08-66]KIM12387.1 MAG: ABC transporter [Sulfuricurvum sp. PC08-66]